MSISGTPSAPTVPPLISSYEVALDPPPSPPRRPAFSGTPTGAPSGSSRPAQGPSSSVGHSNDGLLTPSSPFFPMRRAGSSEDGIATPTSSASSSSTNLPPPPPPKDSRILPQEPLLRAARLKMSSKDQEAMRRIRSTMVDLRDGSEAASASSSQSHSMRSPSASTSPISPRFPSYPAASYGAPMGSMGGGGALGSASRLPSSRRSTLSKLVVPDEPAVPSAPDTNAPMDPPIAAAPAQYVIAVIGHIQTGKTTLVNRAFRPYGVSHPVATRLSSGQTVHTYHSRLLPGGKITLPSECLIVEMDMSAMALGGPSSNNTASTASKRIFSEDIPDVDGVVIVYDAKVEDSLVGVPELIQRLAVAGIPTIMFACKTDVSSAKVINAAHANSFGEPFNVGLIEVTDETSNGRSKMRNGLRYLLWKLESRLLKQRRKASEPTLTASASQTLASPSTDGSHQTRLIWHSRSLQDGSTNLSSTSLASAAATDSERASISSKHSDSGSLHWIMQGPMSSKVSPFNRQGSMAEEMEANASPQDRRSIESAERGSADPSYVKKAELDAPTYLNLQDIFNRLFANIVSMEDDAFVRSFFMTYRRFCRPLDVMGQFLDRLKEIEAYETTRDVKHWALQKLTGALIDWTTGYITDLADPKVQDLFRQIVSLLSKHTFMAHLTVDLVTVEESLTEDIADIDLAWSLKPDVSPVRDVTIGPSASETELVIDGKVLYAFDSASISKSEMMSTPKDQSAVSTRTGSTASIAITESNSRRNSNSHARAGSSSGELRLNGGADDGASKWSGACGYVLTVDPRTFAVELTRMQWQLFSDIRPRDVLKHAFGKEPDTPVRRSIAFFNRISRWVATIILAGPRPKHRARVYERFMLIAHQLRLLNNYESMYALLMGMSDVSIDRLAQTHMLVQPNPDVVNSFASHQRLMSSQSGFANYKRALEADLTYGRPAIPLLMTIFPMIVKLQSVRPEDIRSDGMVQWDKFMRFGEILSVLSDCQARGPIAPGAPSSTFASILNDTVILDDEDDLYDRSKALEPGGHHGVGPGHGRGSVLKRLGKLVL